MCTASHLLKMISQLLLLTTLVMTVGGHRIELSTKDGYRLVADAPGKGDDKNITFPCLSCKFLALGQDFCCAVCHLISYNKCECLSRIFCHCFN